MIWRTCSLSSTPISDRVSRQVIAVLDKLLVLTTCKSQSSKEEIEGGRLNDFRTARDVVDDLRAALHESQVDVNCWGGEFPFERAAAGLEYWKF